MTGGVPRRGDPRAQAEIVGAKSGSCAVLAALAAASILLFVQPPATAPTTTDITYPVKITYNSGSVTVTTSCGTVQASKSPDDSLTLIPNNLPGAKSSDD